MRDRTMMSAIFLLLTAGLHGPAHAQGAKTPDPFREATIRVKGFGKFAPGEEGTPRGKLKAERAAKIMAMRNVAALFGKMEIRGDENVKKIVVRGLVSGARQVGDAKVEGGWVVVTVEVPLSAIVDSMAGLQEGVNEAKERNRQLQEALGSADSNLRRMRDTLEKLKKAIANIEAKLKEDRK